jgi:predicted deacetylase
MYKYKNYKIKDIPIKKTEQIIEEYLSLSRSPTVKILDIKLDPSKLTINIEKHQENKTNYTLWKEFNRLMKAIRQKGKLVYFWFRDDDVEKFTPYLKNFLDYFSSNDLPVLLGVIPATTDANCAFELKRYRKILTIGQHGYSHRNHSNQDEVQSEYNEHREIDAVTTEVNRGQQKLISLYGEMYLNIFIPPWFEISTKIYNLLEKNGYKYFSIYSDNKRKNKETIEINSQVDLINWDNCYGFGGERFVLNQLIRELNRINESASKDNLIGLLFHHERVDEETYLFMDRLVSNIKKHKNIQIIDIKGAIKLIKHLY